MSRFRLSLRLIGEIASLEAIAALADGLAYSLRRRHERIDNGERIQPANVLVVDLARWERPGVSADDDRDAILTEERAKLASATATLQRLAPALASLDRAKTQASVWLSTIRKEDQGGFGLPAELVAACAAGGLEIEVSILVALDEE